MGVGGVVWAWGGGVVGCLLVWGRELVGMLGGGR
eukprot:COSAG02_NODE_1483_length_12385_cov_116.196565_2_plen_34_part_00